MVLGWLAVGITEFVLLFFTASESGETLFLIYGALITLSLLTGACGLQIKGQSMAWMLLCFVPFGLVVILVLKNRNAIKGE